MRPRPTPRRAPRPATSPSATPFHAADESYWKNIAFWNTPIEQCLDGRTDVKCVPYAKWVQAWTEIKG